MRILFISTLWGDVYGNYKSAAKVGNAYPPLGLCYLSAVLENKGHLTKIIDMEMESKNINDVFEEIENYKPDAIGITVTTPIFHIVANVAESIKAKYPQMTIFVGGPHCSATLDESLKRSAYIDYAIYGEGERTIIEFINTLMGKKRPGEVAGLIFRDRKKNVIVNKPAKLIEDLDSLPFPAREKLDMEKYTWGVPGKGIVKFTTIMTSRGCPFNCIFCSAHTIFGKRVRCRDIGLVLDEIEMLYNKHDIKHFAFIDDTLTLDHERIKKMCDGIKKRRLDITWEGWTRANTVNHEILKSMKEAGFTRISFGIESANKEISRLIRKQVPLESYAKAYSICKDLGIERRASIILGNPGETRETAMETLRFAKGLKDCDQIYINIATPYPSTELYDMAKKGMHGLRLLSDDYSDYKRYGNSVLEVNDLKAEDLVKLQKKGFRMFYFTPSRVIYNIKRAGLRAFFKNAMAFFKSVILSGKTR